MNKSFLPFIVIIFLAFLSNNSFGTELKFDPVETESMLYLFNQTKIKGSEVEMFAPLQAKLIGALDKARNLPQDSTTVSIELSTQELDICLQILNNANVEAKYLDLILNMKNKIKDQL
ncbi:hypothetical protein GF407_14250 [candidate division KSB1 bacterium]|nr:hypothetical protein [candidate division KSB1 bacterium]